MHDLRRRKAVIPDYDIVLNCRDKGRCNARLVVGKGVPEEAGVLGLSPAVELGGGIVTLDPGSYTVQASSERLV